MRILGKKLCLESVSMDLCIRINGIYVCWLACEDEDTWPRDLSELLMAVKVTW